MYCTKCGKKIEDGAMYCRYCGAKNTAIGKEIKVTDDNGKGHAADRMKTDIVSKSEKFIQKNMKAILAAAAAVFIGFICFTVLKNNIISKATDCEYRKHPKMEYLEMNRGSVVVDSSGRVISSEQQPFHVTDIADNGVMAGQYYAGIRDVLAIMKDGEVITVSDKTTTGILCGSGKKLIYRDPDQDKVYSYDIDSGESTEIYQDAYVEYVSYNGNVIGYSNGNIRVGKSLDSHLLWTYKAIGASDSGKQAFFSGYNFIDEENVFGINNIPGAIDFIEKDSTATYSATITAHDTSFSEILYDYDGDTYYYNAGKGDKKLIASGVTLLPVEEVYEYNSITNKTGIDPYELYVNGFINTPLSDYELKHGVATIKGHIYCAYDYKKCRVDLVYLDNDLKTQMLVDNITALPVVAGNGRYIWTAAYDTIYRIDLGGKEPKLLSQEINGLGYTLYSDGDYEIALPLAVMNDGKTAYCIGDTYYIYEVGGLKGTLYYVDFDNKTSVASEVEYDVTSCAAGDKNNVYYTLTDSESYWLKKLYSCANGGEKSKVAGNVYHYHIVNSRLYVIRIDYVNDHDMDGQFNLYEYSDGELKKIAENVDY